MTVRVVYVHLSKQSASAQFFFSLVRTELQDLLLLLLMVWSLTWVTGRGGFLLNVVLYKQLDRARITMPACLPCLPAAALETMTGAVERSDWPGRDDCAAAEHSILLLILSSVPLTLTCNLYVYTLQSKAAWVIEVASMQAMQHNTTHNIKSLCHLSSLKLPLSSSFEYILQCRSRSVFCKFWKYSLLDISFN